MNILAWIKTNGGKHIWAIAIAAALILGGRLWLAEHDASLQADATVKAAQAQIDALKSQRTTIAKAAQLQVTVLQKQADAVKTAPEATAALQQDAEVKTALPSLAVLPDSPGKVQVDALELFKGVNKCEQDSIQLGACVKELDIQTQIDTKKDEQITALKKKPGFWKRMGKAAKVIGCAAGGGAAGSLAGAKGAAIGAAVGAGVCQAF